MPIADTNHLTIMRDVFVPYPADVLDVELDEPVRPVPIRILGSPDGDEPVGYVEHWRLSRHPLGVLIDLRATTDTGRKFLQAVADGAIHLSLSLLIQPALPSTEAPCEYPITTRLHYPYCYDPAVGFLPIPSHESST